MSELNGFSGEIRNFVHDHFDGWGHEDWLSLLHRLGQEGHDVSDPDAIGLVLEQERIRQTLKECKVKGLGPKRIDSVANAFGTLNDLRQVPGPELAHRVGIPSKVAQDLIDSLG